MILLAAIPNSFWIRQLALSRRCDRAQGLPSCGGRALPCTVTIMTWPDQLRQRLMPEINPYVGEFVREASPLRSGEAFRPTGFYSRPQVAASALLNGGRGGQNPHIL
jgi:hypothetical protein